MTEIDEVLARCTRTWRRFGVPRDEQASMADELRADLAAAIDSGAPVSNIVGNDADAFAREWAQSRGVVRPRWRLASTTAVAMAGALPAVAFALVLPLMSTSDWGVEHLVKLFPGQRSRTNLDCGPPATTWCPPTYWDPPGWLLALWYGLAAVLAVVGIAVATGWWLDGRADPAAAETRRMLSIGAPLGAVLLGVPMLAINASRPGIWFGNGGWVPVLACGAIATIGAARLAAVLKSRRGALSTIA